ncbi:MAG: hypothetical protein QXP77_00470 [Candidatus Aenigmatarchaeota archaeon]
MEKIELIKIFPLILAFTIVPQTQAVGSLQKNNFVEIEKNGIANFKILFWNTENVSYPIKLEVRKKPENFFVLIEPKEFILPPSQKGPPYEEGEYISLPSGDFKAFPVNIYVKDSGENGEQEVLISALIGSEKDQLTFLMEKSFSFKVKTSSSLQIEKVNEGESVSITTNISSYEKKILDLKLVFYILTLLVFITISVLVYRHA